MDLWNTAILAGALLLVLSIVASGLSSRLGAPLLLAATSATWCASCATSGSAGSA